uniref:Peptidase S1 domain-containing protein n=1 Tax=Panagrolaimus superbus TaxID=310955 RepID=A0A914YJB3_9BILA
MLIKLKQPLKFTRDITNVCLVRNVTAVNGDFAAVVGFGERFKNVKNVDATEKEHLKLQDINFKDSTILHETPLMIRDMDYCKSLEAFAVNRVCAGGEMQGTTRGDSGGPLLVVRNDRWIQLGVTSYGSYKAVAKDVNRISDLGVYTKVSAYCDWIEKSTAGEIKCK